MNRSNDPITQVGRNSSRKATAGNSRWLKDDVEHVFNLLIPKEYVHAGSVPHVFQPAIIRGRQPIGAAYSEGHNE